VNLSRADVALLNLVADDWTTLDVAPTERQAEAMERRRHDEVHNCLRCGRRAVYATIAEFKPVPDAAPRWVDLCADCYQWVLELANE